MPIPVPTRETPRELRPKPPPSRGSRTPAVGSSRFRPDLPAGGAMPCGTAAKPVRVPRARPRSRMRPEGRRMSHHPPKRTAQTSTLARGTPVAGCFGTEAGADFGPWGPHPLNPKARGDEAPGRGDRSPCRSFRRRSGSPRCDERTVPPPTVPTPRFQRRFFATRSQDFAPPKGGGRVQSPESRIQNHQDGPVRTLNSEL